MANEILFVKVENGDGKTLAVFTATFKPDGFKTGGLGWYAGGKMLVDDQPVQVGCNLSIIGSKDTPDAQKRIKARLARELAEKEKAAKEFKDKLSEPAKAKK